MQSLFLFVITLYLVISCKTLNKNISDTKWVQISESKVELEKYDFNSDYHMKIKVLSVKGQFSNELLSYSFSEHVSLNIDDSGEQEILNVVNQRDKVLMSYLVTKNGEQKIVDFAAPNFQFNFTDSANQQRTLKLQQTKAVKLNKDNFEINCTVLADSGNSEIVFSLSLNRNLEVDDIDPNFVVRTGEDGNKLGFGFLSEFDENIQRFPTPKQGDKVVFILEDFPKDLHEIAIQAVKSWNGIFGMEYIDAVIGDPSDRRWGDRRYHVIQWIDLGPQSALGNANYRFYDSKGQIYSGNIQMNAAFYQKAMKRGELNSELASYFTVSGLQIGNIDLQNSGDSCSDFAYFPISDSQDNLTYVQRAYHNTLIHEVGHVLGLDHNFKGSIYKVDKLKVNSVMDYNPREFNTNHLMNPGPYDFAALRWVYYGEVPTEKFEYCNDDGVEVDWQCNKFDWGDPMQFLAQQIQNYQSIFTLYDKPMELNTDTFFELMVTFEKILAIWYKYQNIELPSDKEAQFLSELNPKMEKILNLSPTEYKLNVYPEVQKLSRKYINCLESDNEKCKIMF